MSQIPRSPAVCENEHSREVPSSAANSDSQDKDYKVIVNIETNEITVVGPYLPRLSALQSLVN